MYILYSIAEGIDSWKVLLMSKLFKLSYVLFYYNLLFWFGLVCFGLALAGLFVCFVCLFVCNTKVPFPQRYNSLF